MEGYFGSESSSGCESGWTVYLEHSHSIKNHQEYKKDSFTYNATEEEEEEEDMSMVSDASSGPQHNIMPDQQDECNNNRRNGKMKKIHKVSKLNKKIIHDLPNSFLDDTASSPLFNFSNNNLTVGGKNNNNGSMVENDDIIDYSQGYSTTYFKGESAFQDHFGFFHPLSSAQVQQNQWLEEKRWG